MKTAIYIEDGTMQLVLTPESDYEKKVVDAFGDNLGELRVMQGEFYGCRGGWIRHREPPMSSFGQFGNDRGDRSLIIRIDKTLTT